jgi:hypothetical protein
MLYKIEKNIKVILRSFSGEIEKYGLISTWFRPLSSFEIHRNKEILKEKQKKHYERYCENIYIYNNVLTIKDIFAISQELLCLKKHCYYKNNFIYLEEQFIHQLFPIPTPNTIYT